MDIKVNNVEQSFQPEAVKQVQDAGSDAFRFALMSNIQESELQERLSNLMSEITAEGEVISKRKNIKDMRRYRALVKDFMNEILNRSHQFSRQNFLDKKGRHRVYGIIKLVDQNLDDLAAELLKDESDNIAILAKIGEIRGLLIDLLTEYMEKAVAVDRIGQSYIFEGAKGTDRQDMALSLAAALLCKGKEGQSRPCKTCHSCSLMESRNHPDCITVTHEKPSTVSVKDIREQVIDDIDIRPYYGGRKIYIIPDAEMMSPGAQNALLKTIEEPPDYAVVILIVTDAALLLETIRSRCMILSFRKEPVFVPEGEELQRGGRGIPHVLCQDARNRR